MSCSRLSKGKLSLFLGLVILVSETAAAVIYTSAPAQAAPVPTPVPGAPKALKVALVNFLSGVPATAGANSIKAGQLLIDRINTAGGIRGVKIQPMIVDEAGGVEKQVTELRRLVMEEKVDAVVGYLSSADCLGVAPVADELRTLTLYGGCGTSQLFERAQYKYVFRPVNYEGSENVAAALYALSIKPDLETIAGVNQDYAWGRDSWETFRRAMLKLKPNVRVVEALWPKLGAVDFSTEISKVLAVKADVVHNSLWAGFLDSFIKQAVPRRVFEQSLVVSIVGERSLLTARKDMPRGAIVGGRGGYLPYIWPDPKNPEAKNFYDAYEAKFGEFPIADAFYMAQNVLALKAAYEKAIDKLGRWPTVDEVIKALEFLEFDSLGIHVSMDLANGHQATHPQVFGITGSKRHPKWGFPLLENVQFFPAKRVNPPPGAKHLDWIASWPAGKGP